MNTYKANKYFFYGHQINDNLRKSLIVSSGMGCIYGSQFNCDRKTLDNFGILYVTKGTLTLGQFGNTYIIKEGQGIMLPFMSPHYYHLDHDDSCMLWIHFNGDTILPLMKFLEDYSCFPFIFNNADFLPQFIDLHNLMKDKIHPNYIEISSCLYNIIISIIGDTLNKITASSTPPPKWFVKEINIYINSHIYENITIQDLCQVVNVKTSYFNKLFKTYFNETPHKYIINKKLEYSLDLLTKSDISISQISHNLAFSDQSHYSNAFKKSYNMSPLQYRKLNLVN